MLEAGGRERLDAAALLEAYAFGRGGDLADMGDADVADAAGEARGVARAHGEE